MAQQRTSFFANINVFQFTFCVNMALVWFNKLTKILCSLNLCIKHFSAKIV